MADDTRDNHPQTTFTDDEEPAVLEQAGFNFAMVPEALIQDQRVNPTAVRVWMAWARAAKSCSKTFKRQREIAEWLGVTHDTVQRATRSLAEAGWLKSDPWFRQDGSQGPNTTTVIYDPSREIPTPPPRRTPLTPPRDRQGGAAPDAVARREIDVESNERENTRAAVSSLFGTEEPSPSFSAKALAEERFQKFWKVYPARDGKKVGKAKALRQWMRLKPEDHKAAWVGVRHYADSGWRPKDAERWLRDRCWEEWQEPAVVPDRVSDNWATDQYAMFNPPRGG